MWGHCKTVDIVGWLQKVAKKKAGARLTDVCKLSTGSAQMLAEKMVKNTNSS